MSESAAQKIEDSIETGGSTSAGLDDVFASGEIVEIPDDVKEKEAVKEITEPHIMFHKEEIQSLLRIVTPAKSSGTNIYDKSVLIRPSKKPGEYDFIFTCFGVRYITTLVSSSPSPKHLSPVSAIVDIDSLNMASRFCSEHLIMYVRDKGLFSSLFGGEAYTISHLNADTSPYDSGLEKQKNVVIEQPIDCSSFSGALSIASVGRSQQSAQQKILYFDSEGAFINAGGIFIRYKTTFPEYAVQPRGVAVLLNFFKASNKDIKFGMDDHNLYFEESGSILTVEKIQDKMPSSSKDMFKQEPIQRTSVSLQHLAGIAQILSSSSFEGGIVDFSVDKGGVRIISKGKDGAELSKFTLGAPEGSGRVVSVSVDSLKSTLSLFKGSMNLTVGVTENILNLQAGNITSLVAGKER